MSTLDDLLGTVPSLEALDSSSLRALYTDPTVFETERSALFARTWSLVASAGELGLPGSYVTATPAGIPLVVIRGEDGVLRAFHNVCRHRGITLLEGSGRTGRFVTCPYHQWTYGSDGSLIRVPQREEQFCSLDRGNFGMVAASVAEWGGMVFANPSSRAPSLHEAMAGLDDRLNAFAPESLQEVAVVHYEAACNWKLLVENHIDVYHLWNLHSKTLSGFDHRAFRWESLGDNWWSLEPMKRSPEHRIGAYLLFPNLMLVTTDDYFATYDATPLGPGRTVLTLRVRAPEGADGAALVAAVRSFMSEDVDACERMQRGASSPHFTVGALASTHEEPIRRFHRSLANWLAA